MAIKLRKKTIGWKDIIFVIYFMYMLDPFFINSIVSVHRLVYYFVAMLPLVFSLLSSNGKILLQKDLKLYLGMVLIYTGWVFLLSAILGGDLAYFSDYIKWIFKILNCCSLFMLWKWLYSSKNISLDFEMSFMYAVEIYVIISLFFIAFPSVKNGWINFIYNDKQPMYIILDDSYVTRYGLAGWSSFAEAYMVLFSSIFLFEKYIDESISKLSFSTKLIIMLIGSFLYGRFALVVLLFLIIIFVLYTIIREKKLWIFRRLCIILAAGVVITVFLYNYNDSTNAIISWAFEPILNYYSHKTLSVNSTYELSEMYKDFNPNIQELVIGSGRWYEIDGKPYKYTDVGFMRNIYFAGVLGAGFLYLCDFYLIYIYIRKLRDLKYEKGTILMIIFLIVVLIAADLKGNMAVTFVRYLLPLVLAKNYYIKIKYRKERCVNGRER